ncbi:MULTISPECIES: histidinol-phosphatase [unclassified Bradyrhizobium]|uniref:histidinol-phosphatase n=1 Tax=Bradyrhizobium sp. USDA 4541 TaxID=2817704 RepID=UPI0020A38FCC|nr:histidinol-phosphatase [Bradyrhizobium sp. USDA 4541]MCP1854776.1 myo-inositol-1(or 4)-monophosphatase [Bradyrhizobium sp. USDA 4541]
MDGADSMSDLVDFAFEIAGSAGSHATEWFRRPIDINTKDDESPVTEADRRVEQAIRKAISARFPEHSIFGEEYGIQGDLDSPTWVVDPIDGTRSFISGSPLWGTLVALAIQGRSQIGVVEMPALRERWTGATGLGSWFVNSSGIRTKCQVRDCRRLADANFYTTSPLYFAESERDQILGISQTARMCRFGGDCYNYGLLASGHIDLVIETRMEPYDFMALVPVIEEAGGIVTDWEGKPLTITSGKRVIAASTAELHAEVLPLL